MPPPQKHLKLFRHIQENWKPGDDFYTTINPNHFTAVAGRIGLDYDMEKVLIIEGYKTEEPRIIKAVKITIR